MTPEAVIIAARGYLGTPWKHQARVKGVGVDCIGLLVGAFNEAGTPIKDCIDYGKNPNPRRFLAHLARQFRRISGANQLDVHADPSAWMAEQPGDVLVFQFQGPNLPQHVGIATDRGVIHTYQSAGAVSEHALTHEWCRKVHSVWRVRA